MATTTPSHRPIEIMALAQLVRAGTPIKGGLLGSSPVVNPQRGAQSEPGAAGPRTPFLNVTNLPPRALRYINTPPPHPGTPTLASPGAAKAQAAGIDAFKRYQARKAAYLRRSSSGSPAGGAASPCTPQGATRLPPGGQGGALLRSAEAQLQRYGSLKGFGTVEPQRHCDSPTQFPAGPPANARRPGSAPAHLCKAEQKLAAVASDCEGLRESLKSWSYKMKLPLWPMTLTLDLAVDGAQQPPATPAAPAAMATRSSDAAKPGAANPMGPFPHPLGGGSASCPASPAAPQTLHTLAHPLSSYTPPPPPTFGRVRSPGGQPLAQPYETHTLRNSTPALRSHPLDDGCRGGAVAKGNGSVPSTPQRAAKGISRLPPPPAFAPSPLTEMPTTAAAPTAAGGSQLRQRSTAAVPRLDLRSAAAASGPSAPRAAAHSEINFTGGSASASVATAPAPLRNADAVAAASSSSVGSPSCHSNPLFDASPEATPRFWAANQHRCDGPPSPSASGQLHAAPASAPAAPPPPTSFRPPASATTCLSGPDVSTPAAQEEGKEGVQHSVDGAVGDAEPSRVRRIVKAWPPPAPLSPEPAPARSSQSSGRGAEGMAAMLEEQKRRAAADRETLLEAFLRTTQDLQSRMAALEQQNCAMASLLEAVAAPSSARHRRRRGRSAAPPPRQASPVAAPHDACRQALGPAAELQATAATQQVQQQQPLYPPQRQAQAPRVRVSPGFGGRCMNPTVHWARRSLPTSPVVKPRHGHKPSGQPHSNAAQRSIELAQISSAATTAEAGEWGFERGGSGDENEQPGTGGDYQEGKMGEENAAEARGQGWQVEGARQPFAELY